MRRSALIALITVSFFPLSAWGLSVPNGGGWQVNPDLDGSVRAQKSTPVVAVSAYLNWQGGQSPTTSDAIKYVLMDVRDPMGNRLSGTLSYSDATNAIIWHGNEDLTIGVTYAVRLMIQNNKMTDDFGGGTYPPDIDVTFDLEIEDGPPVPAAIERISANPPDSLLTATCYTPQLEIRVLPDAPVEESIYYPVEFNPQAIDASCSRTGYGALCSFPDQMDASEYCVDVTVTSLYDDSTDSESICVAASTFEAQDEGCADNSGCDCQITSANSQAPSHWLILLSLLGLVVLRARNVRLT